MTNPQQPSTSHSPWVKSTHWIVSLSFLVLAFSGFMILMVHPRLYWGEIGNDLTPAFLELPISRNYQHNGFENRVAFFNDDPSRVSASRTYDIFNENGWGRSLHFLAAWFLVITGMVYLINGFVSRHFKRNILPKRAELNKNVFIEDIKDHLKFEIPPPTGGPEYRVLQKSAYLSVIFLALPLMVITGFAMSPAITGQYHFLSSMFGGVQSARTIHFFASVALVGFMIIHLVMVIKSGFRKHLRTMTFWRN